MTGVLDRVMRLRPGCLQVVAHLPDRLLECRLHDLRDDPIVQRCWRSNDSDDLMPVTHYGVTT